jgi:hypothetical protein
MKNYIFLSIVSLILLTSCSDDFVELTPEDSLNTETFYKTKDDFNTAIIAAYAKLQGQVSLYFELVEWRSDNLFLSAPTAGTQDRYDISLFDDTSANGIVLAAWANFYNGVFRTNVILDKIKQANFDENLKKRYEAEARFLRALNYFNIVRIWGDAPIVLKEITAKESLTIGRSPASEVYKVIEDDLKFAVNNLPPTYTSVDFGRATSGAAKTLLGKVYLTQGKFPEAVTELTSVIGKYSLLPNIVEVFDVNKKTNNEVIFSIRFNKEVTEEGHALWFSISDVSTSPFTSKLTSSYSSTDSRKSLINYRSSGKLFVPGKFYDTESVSTKNFGNDYILLRYSDVLLMLAEALNEVGYNASGSAFSYLNDVRKRANLAPLTSIAISNQASFRSAVLNERLLEFPLEGHRWFDLIRTKTAKAEIFTGIGINIEDYQLLYPVPQAEIQKINNTSIFYQNEGY